MESDQSWRSSGRNDIFWRGVSEVLTNEDLIEVAVYTRNTRYSNADFVILIYHSILDRLVSLKFQRIALGVWSVGFSVPMYVRVY